MHIDWDEKWSIGNELIDAHHKEFIKAANKFVFSSNEDCSNVSTVLAFLMEYVAVHFYEEEKLLEKCGYPDIKQHKLQHTVLKANSSRLATEYEMKGASVKLKANLKKLIADWLLNHIEIEDKKIGDYIQKKKK